LIGDSGSGKSTLMRCIAGFTDLQQGEVDLQSMKVAMLLQNPFYQIIMQSVKDELEFPLKNAGIAEAEISVRVQELAELLEIKDLLYRDISTLSFGETQMVMIAATCLTPADIYLMDEPTSHLDPPKIQLFYHVMRQLCTLGKSVCIASQSIDEYHFVDRIVLMEKGRIVANVARNDADVLFHDKGMQCDATMLNRVLEGFSRS
jgi:energy-coupling factor transport system ATP-binding protein